MQYGNEYLETRVMTATPQELHMMVVDGAVRFAMQAEESMADDDLETSHLALNRSREFVVELISGLDQDSKEAVVEQLRQVFSFVYRSLTEADLEHDIEKIRGVLKVLNIHRDNWGELIAKPKLEQSSEAAKDQTETRPWAS